MTRIIMQAQSDDTDAHRKPETDRWQVTIHVQAAVIDPEVARRKANVWLLINAGNLLGAVNPELVLGDPLLWRFDVRLSMPQLDRPGFGVRRRIGQIHLDAVTGEVMASPTLVDELRAAADALVID